MIPRATYRFQFHKDFPFAAAEALVPYLDRLGISHVYASPITTAVAGSTHGYDVIDPTQINPELGGEQAFRSLVAALRARGMGIIIDIVPNHMGVAGGGNAWWNDVLAAGEASSYARFFDIDWSERLVLPVLGAPLAEVVAAGDIAVANEGGRAVVVAYGVHRFPIRDEDQADTGDIVAMLEQQHYRLASWRTANDDLNWRRFFTISELAGLRTEDPIVFEATHALYFRLHAEGLIDGVRVDHVDGLTDPAGYCRSLRERLGPDAYIVVEKILGSGERLAEDWGVNGTSGYDFMNEVAAVLHAPEGKAPLSAFWSSLSGRASDFATEELAARQDILSWQFESQLNRCVSAFAAVAPDGITRGMLRRAVSRLLWVFPVYRTYATAGSAPASDAAVRSAVRARVAGLVPPGEQAVTDLVLDWLAGGDSVKAAEGVRRFQQLSAPIAAKAVEDTAFYRYGRLLSRTDVGFDAERFSATIHDFHELVVETAKTFPHRMLATATHDHKRGEDVRTRLAVLSEIAPAWETAVNRWRTINQVATVGIDPSDEYILYQTLFGAWPEALAADDRAGLADFGDRLIAWQQKALREAKLRSSWEQPDQVYEARGKMMIRTLLDPAQSTDFLRDLAGFVEWTASPARANMLVQTALRFTLPGVPDIYQGTERPDRSLVDPDNRRAVDYAALSRLLLAKDEKPRLIAELLATRREHPALFADGDYQPLSVTGPRADHILAFSRRIGDAVMVVAVALRCANALVGCGQPVAGADWWSDTMIGMPSGVPTDGRAAKLFAVGPVAGPFIFKRAKPGAS